MNISPNTPAATQTPARYAGVARTTLRRLSARDPLTGLHGRGWFLGRLRRAAECAGGRRFAVVLLDLDRFNLVNDALGYEAGDRLLRGAACRLGERLRPGDRLARLGVGEFALLLVGVGDRAEAERAVSLISESLAEPFDIGGQEVFVTASLGVALGGPGHCAAEELMLDAGAALSRAKSLGGARREVFEPAMRARAVGLLRLGAELRRAVEREEFVLHYQPVFALGSGTLRGFEALVRWHHPRLGLTGPADFIPLAEETGVIVQLGRWVLARACHQARAWRQRHHAVAQLEMSVNVSARQLDDPGFVADVVGALCEAGLDPRGLRLEVTEGVLAESPAAAGRVLHELRALGVGASIDDFGTGYSSMSQLQHFPVTALKIDRSFVARVAEGDKESEIVRAVVGLGRNLGMEVVAEGIETEEQVAWLEALGCRWGQGYFFSAPLDAADAALLLPGRAAGGARTRPSPLQQAAR